MGVSGKFSDVSIKDFDGFADKHGIPYARKVFKDVKTAVSQWPDFGKLAGLNQGVINHIQQSLKSI
jgi:hypothetical protein